MTLSSIQDLRLPNTPVAVAVRLSVTIRIVFNVIVVMLGITLWMSRLELRHSHDTKWTWKLYLECTKCGSLNSSSTFDDSSTSFNSSNSFSELDSFHTPHKKQPFKTKKPQLPKQRKILIINFKSIVNKVPELHCLTDSEKPDVVIGTESWLSPDISDIGIFPPGYTPFRADRKSKTTRSGGVFILIRENLICIEQPNLQTDCGLLWVKLEIVGFHPVYIGAYYKPKEDDLDSLLELCKALDLVSKHKGNISLLGDFNVPKLTWPDYTPVLKPDCSCKPVYESFLDILHNFSFVRWWRAHPPWKYTWSIPHHRSYPDWRARLSVCLV